MQIEDKMTRIVIADDHQMIVEGLASLLNELPEVEIVYSATNGVEVLDFLKHEKNKGHKRIRSVHAGSSHSPDA